MSKDVSEVLRECQRVAEAKRRRLEAMRLVTTRDVTVPDEDAEPRDTLRVNVNVRNPAFNGGTTEEWMREFGFTR